MRLLVPSFLSTRQGSRFQVPPPVVELDLSSDGRGTGNTYYVDANAANDSGSGSYASPKKYLTSGMALLSASGGDTLVLKPGTFSHANDLISTNTGAGTALHWNWIKAETPGTAFITQAFGLPMSNHYMRFEGINFWSGTNQKGCNGKYAKFIRCSFKGGPLTENNMNFGIGDSAAGTEYILMEDCWFFGVGGRYSLLVYNSDHIVLRRCLVRHQVGWSDTKGDPQAGIAVYNSVDVLTQNCFIVDTPNMTNFEAGYYHPSNSRASANIIDNGFICVNCPEIAGIGWDDGATTPNMQLNHAIMVNTATPGFVNGGPKTVVWNNVTAITSAAAGPRNYSTGTLTINKSVFSGMTNGTNTGGVTLGTGGNVNNFYNPTVSGQNTLNPATNGITWPVRREAGSNLLTADKGATVMTKLGARGTIWGESGYDQDTGWALWPWPYEDQIKAELAADSAIGFCTGNQLNGNPKTLTSHVWESSGVQMPVGIY